MKILKVTAILCAITSILSVTAAAVTTMSVIDIAPGIGTEEWFMIGPLAVNNPGEVVGTIDTPAGLRGFIWDDGVLTTMGCLGSSIIPWPAPKPWSSTHDINDSGQVVGTSWTSEVFLWDNGQMSRLPGLHPSHLVIGRSIGSAAINNAGQVVGKYYRGFYPDEDIRCFLWQDGVVTELDHPNVWPSEINDLGVITGGMDEPGRHSAFVWKDGVFTKIDDVTGWNTAYGADINNAGQVVGGMGMTAFLWQNGVLTMLGGFADSYRSTATAINDAGQVVGTSRMAGDGSRAVLWEDGVVIDLNSLIPAECDWTLQHATDISESGDIVGYGFHRGEFRQFLYTEVDLGIAIDVKPGDSSNRINLRSKGVVPVAVLASPDHPITSIDTSTISFAGAKPERQTVEDVDGDGDQDLLLHFRIPALRLDTNSTDANLIGRLSNGCLFVSSDAIRIVPR